MSDEVDLPESSDGRIHTGLDLRGIVHVRVDDQHIVALLVELGAPAQERSTV